MTPRLAGPTRSRRSAAGPRIDFERFHRTKVVPTGGIGFRYEPVRKYGIHAGLDVALGPDNSAVYVQVGSAWARP